MEVCIEKDPEGNPKPREAFVDQLKLFTMALAATALLSRYMHLNHPHDTPTNVRRLMEADKNWEADLAGCIVLDYPHPATAASTLMAGFPPYYPNILWGMDKVTRPSAAVMTPIMQWADRYRMLDSMTGMFMHRFNVKGSEVPMDFNTISIITAALGLMCKRAVDMVSDMDTSGVATNMQATHVVAKMTYP
eukprot:jgi/Tetstr1/437013/TSEL_025773.t1